MALNEIYRDAYSLSYSFGTVNPAIASGDFVFVSVGLRGVAETAAAVRLDGTFHATLRHVGVFEGDLTGAVAVGAPIYLAAAATKGRSLTTTVTGNNLVGYAVRAKGTGAGKVWVRVNN